MMLCLLGSAPVHAQSLSGSWCGLGEQTNPDGTRHHWTARMRLAGPEGRMDYPSLDCGGTLTFERAAADVHFYRERITYGRDRCIDDGLVAVEAVETSVRWEWVGSSYKASAVLAPSCPERPISQLWGQWKAPG
jgi:hypothetical protein